MLSYPVSQKITSSTSSFVRHFLSTFLIYRGYTVAKGIANILVLSVFILFRKNNIEIIKRVSKSLFKSHLHIFFYLFSCFECIRHYYFRIFSFIKKCYMPMCLRHRSTFHSLFITKRIISLIAYLRRDSCVVYPSPILGSIRSLHIVVPVSTYFEIKRHTCCWPLFWSPPFFQYFLRRPCFPNFSFGSAKYLFYDKCFIF